MFIELGTIRSYDRTHECVIIKGEKSLPVIDYDKTSPLRLTLCVLPQLIVTDKLSIPY